MELPPWASLLAVALVLLVTTTLLLRRRGGRRYRLPPGPKPWPIIGNLHQMGALPHRSIHALSKRYGPLMQLRFGSVPVVVGSSPEMARLFLKTHDAVFAGRPRTAAGRYTTYNSSDILWSPYGAHWRQLRKVGTAEFLGPAQVESFEFVHVRREEERVLLRGLHRSAVARRAVPLRERLFTSSFGVITRMVLGDKYVEVDGVRSLPSPLPAVSMTPEELTWLMDEFFYVNGVLNVGDYIPWLQWLDLQGCVGRMKKVSKAMDGFVSHVVGEHIERRRVEGESFVARDVVDALLELDLANDPSVQPDAVKALTLDLLAGANNSGITAEWAMSELLRKPEIMGMASEELDRVVGRGRLVEESDLPMLPYMEAIVKETLRVHPVAPLLVPHEAREDATVGGYDVLAGTRVVISAWAMARDPSLWDEPEEFRPKRTERFMATADGSKVDVSGQDMEMLPFGSGRRMCSGVNLGLRVTLITLANLLHG